MMFLPMIIILSLSSYVYAEEISTEVELKELSFSQEVGFAVDDFFLEMQKTSDQRIKYEEVKRFFARVSFLYAKFGLALSEKIVHEIIERDEKHEMKILPRFLSEAVHMFHINAQDGLWIKMVVFFIHLGRHPSYQEHTSLNLSQLAIIGFFYEQNLLSIGKWKRILAPQSLLYLSIRENEDNLRSR